MGAARANPRGAWCLIWLGGLLDDRQATSEGGGLPMIRFTTRVGR